MVLVCLIISLNVVFGGGVCLMLDIFGGVRLVGGNCVKFGLGCGFVLFLLCKVVGLLLVLCVVLFVVWLKGFLLLLFIVVVFLFYV